MTTSGRLDPIGKRVLLYGFIGCFVLLHIYVKLYTQPRVPPTVARAGQRAVPFDGTTLDTSTRIQLAAVAQSHKLVILNFWESWCGPCRVEMPDLQKLYADTKDRGVEMIGIFGASSDESAQQLIQANALTFPMIRDPGGAISKSFGIEAVPSTFVIGPDLKILRSRQGIDAGLKAFIEETLAKDKQP